MNLAVVGMGERIAAVGSVACLGGRRIRRQPRIAVTPRGTRAPQGKSDEADENRRMARAIGSHRSQKPAPHRAKCEARALFCPFSPTTSIGVVVWPAIRCRGAAAGAGLGVRRRRRSVATRQSWSMRAVRACAVLAAATGWAGAVASPQEGATFAARELAAPPEDLASGMLRLGPSPIVSSDHSLLEVRAVSGADRLAHVALQFDHAAGSGDGKLSIVVAMTHPGPWECTLRGPKGDPVYRRGAAMPEGVAEHGGDLAPLLGLGSPVEALRIDVTAAPSGQWSLDLTGPGDARDSRGVVIVAADGASVLHGQFESRVSRIGEPRAFIISADGRIDLREAVVHGPSGAPLAVSVAGTTLSFVPVEEGTHVLTASGRVEGSNGSWASRSVEVIFSVSGSTIRFAGGTGDRPVERRAIDPIRERIEIPVTGAAPGETVLLAGEVWLVRADAAEPVAWLANLAQVADDRLALTFDRRWISRAKPPAADAPGLAGGAPDRIELRSLRIQTRDGGTLIDTSASMDAGVAPAGAPFDPRDEKELQLGRSGGHPIAATVSLGGAADAATGSHALMLVHGYCSDGAPFPAAQFTGALAQFSDPYAARSNDEFAQLIAGFGASFKSYGSVCHSQGGLASLHLYAFYWSGLDWATGPRLIQSVGSPYQGTPLAGNLAVLGAIFGVGCGPVSDMSPEGASAWLAAIPSWARAKVWYWTTSYKDYPFSYDYCDFVSDLFLSNPDDGVIEKSKGQLPGATNMGHTEGWCHTTDMEDPPQCTDATRNAQMNANAAR